LHIKTKDKILEGAIYLFNAEGYSNMSMQRLALHVGLSPGNLTYHYPKKEDLMMALYRLFQLEMSSVMPSSEAGRTNLDMIHQQIDAFYSLQQRFLFFYLDLLDIQRSYPALAEEHYVHVQKQITIIYHNLSNNVERGVLKNGEKEGYQLLAQQIWSTAVFWPSQSRVRGVDEGVDQLHAIMWQLIKPYLTEKGEKQLSALVQSV